MKKIKTLELKGGVDVPINHTSEQYSLGWKDGLKGLLIAVGTAVLPYIYDAINAWLDYKEPDFDWRTMVKYMLAAGVMYLGKNYFRKSAVIINQQDL